MPPFTYRLRFLIPRSRLPHTPQDEPYLVQRPGTTHEIHIRQGSGTRPDDLVVIRRGVPSEEEALHEAADVKKALMRTGLITNVPMLFGTDTSSTWLTPAIIERIREMSGAGARPDVHGIEVVDEADGPSHVVRLEAEGHAGTPIGMFLNEFAASVESHLPGFTDSDKLALAIEVFMAAATEQTPRARFLDFVTVLEVLADQQRRSPPAIEIVDAAISALGISTAVAAEEAQSLRGSLTRLRNRSIGESVQALAEGLDSEAIDGYNGGDVGHFLRRCYAVRSSLVHDGVPREGENMSQLAGSLHFLLRHLLVRLIDGPPPTLGID